MAECNSYETHNIYPNLKDQQQFRSNKINKIKDYFMAEIKQRESMSKRLSKYIVSFDYFGKSLTFSIASFATVIGAPVGTTSASFSLAFSISTRIAKKLLKTMQNKKKSTIMLARIKLNTIESKLSEALINNEITHEDFITIINKERNNNY